MEVNVIPIGGEAPCRPLREATQAGITLIELMVTLAIAGIVLSMAVPTMRDLVLGNRMTARINTLVTHLSIGRSEAVVRNRQVVICKSPDGRHCTTAGTWGDGWILFVDKDRDEHRGGGEPVLRVHGELSGGGSLRYAAFPSSRYLTFEPTGITNANGTFVFCDSRGAAAAKAVIVSKTGRARISRRKANGDALEC